MSKINSTYTGSNYLPADADYRQLEDEERKKRKTEWLNRRKQDNKRGREDAGGFYAKDEIIARQTFAIPFNITCLKCERLVPRGTKVDMNRYLFNPRYRLPHSEQQVGGEDASVLPGSDEADGGGKRRRVWSKSERELQALKNKIKDYIIEFKCPKCSMLDGENNKLYLKTDYETPKTTGGYFCYYGTCKRLDGDFDERNRQNEEYLATLKSGEGGEAGKGNNDALLDAMERENEEKRRLEEEKRKIDEIVRKRNKDGGGSTEALLSLVAARGREAKQAQEADCDGDEDQRTWRQQFGDLQAQRTLTATAATEGVEDDISMEKKPGNAFVLGSSSSSDDGNDGGGKEQEAITVVRPMDKKSSLLDTFDLSD